MTHALSQFFEAIEEEGTGDVSRFQEPTKEEWEFADPNIVEPSANFLDQIADFILDGEAFPAADILDLLAQVFRDYSDSEELETQILLQLNNYLIREADLLFPKEERVTKPSTSKELIASLNYFFQNILKILNKHAQKDIK